MFYMNHYLITAEHWDLLSAQTFVKYQENPPAPPEDLDYFLNLG